MYPLDHSGPAGHPWTYVDFLWGVWPWDIRGLSLGFLAHGSTFPKESPHMSWPRGPLLPKKVPICPGPDTAGGTTLCRGPPGPENDPFLATFWTPFSRPFLNSVRAPQFYSTPHGVSPKS